MKKYEIPELEVIRLNELDIITESSCEGNACSNDAETNCEIGG